MATLRLDPGERRYWHWPVTATVEVPQVKAGSADWAPMELADGYTPDPVVPGATWYRVLFAHPDATTNPPETVIIRQPTFVRIRVAVTPQVFVEDGGWVVPQ